MESIFSVIKRIFNGTNRSRSLKLSNKETKLKNTIYNIYRLTQINKNEDFYKAKNYLKKDFSQNTKNSFNSLNLNLKET